MGKIKALLKNKKIIIAVIVAVLILIGSVSVCVFAFTSSDDKKDNGKNIETVVSEGEKDDTSDTSSKPSSTDEDKDTESKPDESKPEDTSSKQESKPEDTSSENYPYIEGLDDFKVNDGLLHEDDEIGNLSREIVKKIKEDYRKQIGKDISLNKIKIKYYTTLSDGSMVLYIDEGGGKPLLWVTDVIADEYIYGYSYGESLKIYKNGIFKTIKKAYDTGLISKSVLDEFFEKYPNLNSAKSDIPEIRPANRPTDSGGGAQEFLDSLPELTEEEKQEAIGQRGQIDPKLGLEVKQAYAYLWASKGEDFSVDKVTFLKYYGTYNGAAVVKISGAPVEYKQAMELHRVEGVTFLYTDSNYIVVYKDNGFYNIEEAYNEGILTFDDLKKIQIINGIIY